MSTPRKKIDWTKYEEGSEAAIGVKVLNRMSQLGTPRQLTITT